MKDVRNILLTGLVPALATATGLNVYTRIPKAANVTYPYVYISDIYQEEIGSKTEFVYQLDVLVQIVYQDVDSLTGLFGKMDNVLSIINNGVAPFALTSPYKIEECSLNSSTTTEFQTDTGTQNVGLIRILFTIKS